MMIAVPDLLDQAAVARPRSIVDAGEWVDGNVTSGHQSALAKRNMQLAEDSDAAREAAGSCWTHSASRRCSSPPRAAAEDLPALFNRYQDGDAFGTHVDNAVRIHRASEFRVAATFPRPCSSSRRL